MKKEKKHINIGELFSQAWQIYKKNWLNFLLIGFIFLIVNAMGNSAGYNTETGEFVGTSFGFLKLITWLASTYLTIGYVRYLFHLIDGKKARVEEIFHGTDSLTHFIYVFLVSLIVGIIIFFGTILFIIPGIIAALGLMFAKYIIIENKGGRVEVFDAIKESWKITKGYRWKLLWLSIVLGFFNLFGFVALLVGLIITIPMSSIIIASVYKELE